MTTIEIPCHEHHDDPQAHHDPGPLTTEVSADAEILFVDSRELIIGDNVADIKDRG